MAHEALTFFPEPTRMADFDLWEGDEVLDFPGVPGLADELDIELAPVLIAQTRRPGGCVEQATYLTLRDRIVDGIAQAGHLDGICLVLHGALLVDDMSSGETGLVRALRQRIGDDVPIAAQLDLHAILTDEFVRAVDVWTGYRTAPHRDIPETLRRAMTLGVDRVVAMAGCPGGSATDTLPHFAGGGWLPYLENVWDRQWIEVEAPFWSDLSRFAKQQHPALRICLELHPGTLVYNVDTFGRLAELGDNLAANLDPSHYFWQSMDALAIVEALGPRIGYCHAKDVKFIPQNLALNGVMDRRWPNPPEAMPWNFATVGQGQGRDAAWWRVFVAAIARHTAARTLSIEHEDPFVPPAEGVPIAAAVLRDALRALPVRSAVAP
jgi:sugar phosphate isomerase/epimerase